MCVDCKRHVGSHEGLPDSHLHKEEVFSVMMRAARCAGLKVRTEVPAPWVSARSAMDCGWYSATGMLLVAFEFDGRDVGREHISGSEEKGKLGNAEKFRRSGALVRVQALYTLRNERVLPPRKGTTDAMKPEVEVLSDEELHAGVIDDVVARAVGAARERGLTMLGEG